MRVGLRWRRGFVKWMRGAGELSARRARSPVWAEYCREGAMLKNKNRFNDNIIEK